LLTLHHFSKIKPDTYKKESKQMFSTVMKQYRQGKEKEDKFKAAIFLAKGIF
jgi:hypothetical protein